MRILFIVLLAISWPSFTHAQVIGAGNNGRIEQPSVNNRGSAGNANNTIPQSPNDIGIGVEPVLNPLEEAEYIVRILEAATIANFDSTKWVALANSIDTSTADISLELLKNEIDVIWKMKPLLTDEVNIFDLSAVSKIPKQFFYLKIIEKEITAYEQSGSGQSGLSAFFVEFGMKLLNAVVDVSLKMAKQQLLDATLNRFEGETTTSQVTSILLHSTLNLLQTRGEGSIPSGAQWKAAFLDDLKMAPANLADVLILFLEQKRTYPDAVLANFEQVIALSGLTDDEKSQLNHALENKDTLDRVLVEKVFLGTPTFHVFISAFGPDSTLTVVRFNMNSEGVNITDSTNKALLKELIANSDIKKKDRCSLLKGLNNDTPTTEQIESLNAVLAQRVMTRPNGYHNYWKEAMLAVNNKPKINLGEVETNNLKSFLMAHKTMYAGVLDEKKPLEIFGELANAYNSKPAGNITSFERGVLMADVLMDGFVYRIKDNKKYAVAIVDPLAFTKADNHTLSVYFSLWYYRNQTKVEKAFKITSNNIAELNKHLKTINTATQKLSGLVSSIHQITMTSADKEGASAKKANKYIEQILQIIDVSFELTETIYPNNGEAKKYYEGIMKPFARNMIIANQGIANDEYGEVLMASINVLNDVAKFIKEEASDTTAASKLETAAKHLHKYGDFMVSMVMADSSEAMEAALLKLIPKNQYRLKEETKFSVSLVTYPGIRAGGEVVQGKLGSFVGPTLPIGFEAAWGLRSKGYGKAVGAHGIFIHLIETGALLNYRLSNNDEVESEPDINPKTVFSPGVYFTTHFRKTPITLGLGYSISPALRDIEGTTPKLEQHAHQFGAYLAIDVTFFTFSTNKKPFKNY